MKRKQRIKALENIIKGSCLYIPGETLCFEVEDLAISIDNALGIDKTVIHEITEYSNKSEEPFAKSRSLAKAVNAKYILEIR